MAYSAPIVGYIDSLGMLDCTDCFSFDRPADATTADNSANIGEVCERCKKEMPNPYARGTQWHNEYFGRSQYD